jgi:TonB family protein
MGNSFQVPVDMTTTLMEPPGTGLRVARAGLGVVERRHGGSSQAWKDLVGNRPVEARLAVLDNNKPRWDTFGASFLAQCLLVAFLLLVPLVVPEKFSPLMHYQAIAIGAPPAEVLQPPKPPKIRPKIQPVLPKVEEPPPETPKVAKLFAPKPAFPQPLRPKPVDLKTPELKAVDFEATKLAIKTAQPARPRDPIKVGNLATTGSAAPATVVAPVAKVQTGGFGDPSGLPGPGDPNKRANINQKGSLALPPGPGYGNGTGGAKGIRGTVASTGFGNGTAIPPSSATPKQGTVKQAGFSDASAAVAEAPKKKAVSGENNTTPVDILDKPRPEYSEDARRSKIEGDVVVEVVFLASGQVQVSRVVSGLGHGLDEAALRAAQQIKFKPARSDGQPVDFPARVRIEFRLAY